MKTESLSTHLATTSTVSYRQNLVTLINDLRPHESFHFTPMRSTAHLKLPKDFHEGCSLKKSTNTQWNPCGLRKEKLVAWRLSPCGCLFVISATTCSITAHSSKNHHPALIQLIHKDAKTQFNSRAKNHIKSLCLNNLCKHINSP